MNIYQHTLPAYQVQNLAYQQPLQNLARKQPYQINLQNLKLGDGSMFNQFKDMAEQGMEQRDNKNAQNAANALAADKYNNQNQYSINRFADYPAAYDQYIDQTEFDLYGPSSQYALAPSRLTEFEVAQIIAARNAHQADFNKVMASMEQKKVDDLSMVNSPQGSWTDVFQYLDPSYYFQPAAPKQDYRGVTFGDESAYTYEGYGTAWADPAEIIPQREQDLAQIKNPQMRKVYENIENIIAQHGQGLVQNLGQIYTFEITEENGNVIPITVDLKHDQGYFYLGQPGSIQTTSQRGADFTPILTLATSEDNFLKLITKEISAVSALMFGQVTIAKGTMTEAKRFGQGFMDLYPDEPTLMILLI